MLTAIKKPWSLRCKLHCEEVRCQDPQLSFQNVIEDIIYMFKNFPNMRPIIKSKHHQSGRQIPTIRTVRNHTASYLMLGISWTAVRWSVTFSCVSDTSLASPTRFYSLIAPSNTYALLSRSDYSRLVAGQWLQFVAWVKVDTGAVPRGIAATVLSVQLANSLILKDDEIVRCYRYGSRFPSDHSGLAKRMSLSKARRHVRSLTGRAHCHNRASRSTYSER